MDTYIKMCDTPEIQDKWKGLKGDRYTARYFKDSYFVVLEEDLIDVYEVEAIDNVIKDLKEAEAIWLPYQHQIQEMYAEWVWKELGTVTVEDALRGVAWDFAHWILSEYLSEKDGIKTYPTNVFADGNQLTIGFYMYQVHNRKWEDKWI